MTTVHEAGGTTATIHAITDDTFDTEVLGSEVPAIVDFWAPWCGPCRMQAPILEKFAAAHPEVKVCKVNVDESPAVAARYGIRSIPTMAVFLHGQPAVGAVGVQDERALLHLLAEAPKHLTEGVQA